MKLVKANFVTYTNNLELVCLDYAYLLEETNCTSAAIKLLETFQTVLERNAKNLTGAKRLKEHLADLKQKL